MSLCFYPAADSNALRSEYVGKSLQDVPVPAAVLDLCKVKENCAAMLEAVAALKMGWRAHVKTHKTEQVTKLQVGDGSGPVLLVVSTVAEAEALVPLLRAYQTQGRTVNLLYGVPITSSYALRLSRICKELGSRALSVMVDHPAQLEAVGKIFELSGTAPDVFIKIDMGYNRAGVIPASAAAAELSRAVLRAERQGQCVLRGLYTHGGHSYGGNAPADALNMLRQEIEALHTAAGPVLEQGRRELVLSVGATPTTSSVRRLLVDTAALTAAEKAATAALRESVAKLRDISCSVEIHAGVYSILDVQQLATHALPLPGLQGAEHTLSWDNLALTVLSEVSSIYPTRSASGPASGFRAATQVLVAAGGLALGREPCKAYSGWGIVSPWNLPADKYTMPPSTGPEHFTGWHVGKISQEHGLLSWNGEEADLVELAIGQRLRIWPNHACIAGAMFDWYFVVDSQGERGDEIVDVWPRWRGW